MARYFPVHTESNLALVDPKVAATNTYIYPAMEMSFMDAATTILFSKQKKYYLSISDGTSPFICCGVLSVE